MQYTHVLMQKEIKLEVSALRRRRIPADNSVLAMWSHDIYHDDKN